MKIYDCFIFFNELDLLELRLKILDPVVDYFVLVEATKTKKWIDKELFFEKNKTRFKKWKDKIIHVVVDDMPKPGKFTTNNLHQLDSKLGLGRWKLEGYQINQIRRGLKNAKPEDIIMVSDVDEIPNPRKFEIMKKILLRESTMGFDQSMYYYYLNGFKYDGWTGTKVTKFKHFKRGFGGKAYRVKRSRDWFLRTQMFFGKKFPVIKNGGWHFSYLSTPEEMLAKMEHLCGQEHVGRVAHSLEEVKRRIDAGEDLYGRKGENITYVSIDESFPDEIRKNRKKYSKYIKKV